MKSLPWFKFESGRYIASGGANGLHPIREYMFLRLIVFSSMGHPRGTFPDDMETIREYVRWDSMANAIAGLIAGLNGKNGQLYGKPISYLDDNAFLDLIRPVLAKFRHDPENKLYWNDLVATQLVTAESGHSEAGKKGAEARWAGHSKANSKAIVEVRSKNEETTIKPSARTAQVDSRFQSFVDLIDRYWKHANPGIPLAFSAAEGKALKTLLAEQPKLTEELFHTCLINRSKSEVVQSERPRVWLTAILNYAHGPLDRYGKPLGANSGQQAGGIDITRAGAGAVRAAVNYRSAQEALSILEARRSGHNTGVDPTGESD